MFDFERFGFMTDVDGYVWVEPIHEEPGDYFQFDQNVRFMDEPEDGYHFVEVEYSIED